MWYNLYTVKNSSTLVDQNSLSIALVLHQNPLHFTKYLKGGGDTFLLVRARMYNLTPPYPPHTKKVVAPLRYLCGYYHFTTHNKRCITRLMPCTGAKHVYVPLKSNVISSVSFTNLAGFYLLPRSAI